MTSLHLLHAAIAQAGDVVDDPSNQRIVNAAVAGLMVVGVVVLLVTVWFWRTTRPDHEVLAPLEQMSRRRFRRLTDDDSRRQYLDAVRVRPTGSGRADDAGSADAPHGDAVDADISEPLPRPVAPTADQSIDPLLRPPPPVR